MYDDRCREYHETKRSLLWTECTPSLLESTILTTKNITGNLEEIVTKLEGEMPEVSVFNYGFRYYRNPTEYEFLKNTTTGELYGPYNTFYVPDWMTEEDSLELGVEVIDPEVEKDLRFDPASESYRDDCDPYTFMVLTQPLEYDPDRVREWIDFIHDTTDGVDRGFRWILMKQ